MAELLWVFYLLTMFGWNSYDCLFLHFVFLFLLNGILTDEIFVKNSLFDFA